MTQAKYLGLRISSDQNWESHISSITSEAHQRLSFLWCKLCHSPHKCCEMAYVSLVCSQLKYCRTIWDPTLQRRQTALEHIQCQAGRWARSQYGTASITGLLQDLGWKDLVNQSYDERLLILYKIIHGYLAIPPDEVNIRKTKRRSWIGEHLLGRPSIEWDPYRKTGWLLEWWSPAGSQHRTPKMSPGSILIFFKYSAEFIWGAYVGCWPVFLFLSHIFFAKYTTIDVLCPTNKMSGRMTTVHQF